MGAASFQHRGKDRAPLEILRNSKPTKENQGNSKGLVVEQHQAQGYHVFYAGDGMSDFEAATRVDVLYAHRTLATECERTNIPFHPFTDFQHMLHAVQEYHATGISTK